MENGGSMPVQQTKASQPPRAGQHQTTMLGNRSLFRILSRGHFPPIFLWTVEWSNTRQSGISHQGLNFAVDTMGRCFDARLTILARERQTRMNFGKPSMRSTLPSGASNPQSSGRQERSGFCSRFWRMTGNSTKLKWRCTVRHSCEELANYSNILPSMSHPGGLDNNFRVICI